MKKFMIRVGLILVIAVGAIWGYLALTYPSASLRYEITVEVVADEQVYSGSSVHQVSYGLGANMNGGGLRGRSSFRGEAVAVDIADRGTLFLLLTGARARPNEPFSAELGYGIDPQQLVRAVFELPVSEPEDIRALPDRVIDDDIPFNRLPMMVRFDDLADPTTVALVNPYDLAASFGRGVSLRRVQVQTTQAPVTEGIVAFVPWFNDPHPRSTPNRRVVWGQRMSSPDLPQYVGNPFRRGF